MPTRQAKDGGPLALFSCPNPDCDLFNRFNAGNLSIAERMGKNRSIRPTAGGYCKAVLISHAMPLKGGIRCVQFGLAGLTNRICAISPAP